MASSSSACRARRTCSTPLWPPSVRPHSTGRPSSTASAPSARAWCGRNNCDTSCQMHRSRRPTVTGFPGEWALAAQRQASQHRSPQQHCIRPQRQRLENQLSSCEASERRQHSHRITQPALQGHGPLSMTHDSSGRPSSDVHAPQRAKQACFKGESHCCLNTPCAQHLHPRLQLSESAVLIIIDAQSQLVQWIALPHEDRLGRPAATRCMFTDVSKDRKHLQDIGAPADAAIHDQRHRPPDGVHHMGQHLHRGWGAVALPTAMVAAQDQAVGIMRARPSCDVSPHGPASPLPTAHNCNDSHHSCCRSQHDSTLAPSRWRQMAAGTA